MPGVWVQVDGLAPTPGPVLHLCPTGGAGHTHLYNRSDLFPLLPQLLLIHLGRGRGRDRWSLPCRGLGPALHPTD